MVVFHLFVDAVQVFYPAVDVEVVDFCRNQLRLDLRNKVVDNLVTLLLFEGNAARNGEICVGVEVLQAKVF